MSFYLTQYAASWFLIFWGANNLILIFKVEWLALETEEEEEDGTNVGRDNIWQGSVPATRNNCSFGEEEEGGGTSELGQPWQTGWHQVKGGQMVCRCGKLDRLESANDPLRPLAQFSTLTASVVFVQPTDLSLKLVQFSLNWWGSTVKKWCLADACMLHLCKWLFPWS